MPKLIEDKISDPEFVEKDRFFAVGDTVWAAKGAGYVKSKIDKIRYDKSVFLSRYFVSTRKCAFWSSFVYKEDKLPHNGIIYAEDGFPFYNPDYYS